MVSIAKEVHELSLSETRHISVDFTGKLDDASPLELLTGTPTVTQKSPGSPQELTITSPVVSTAALTINDVSVITGRAVQFTVQGNRRGNYIINIVCSTNASQVVHGQVNLIVC